MNGVTKKKTDHSTENDPFRQERADRLKSLREARGFKDAKAAAVAKKFVYPSYKSAESGVRGMSFNSAKKYADGYGANVDWLLYGRGLRDKIPSEHADSRIAITAIPLIDLSAVKKFDIRQAVLEATEFTESARHPKFSALAFATRAIDDSMTDASGRSLHSILKGDVLFFEPSLDPQPGMIVLAYVNSYNMAIVRQYADKGDDEAGRKIAELRPLNHLWRPNTITLGVDGEIVATLIRFSRDLIT